MAAKAWPATAKVQVMPMARALEAVQVATAIRLAIKGTVTEGVKAREQVKGAARAREQVKAAARAAAKVMGTAKAKADLVDERPLWGTSGPPAPCSFMSAIGG